MQNSKPSISLETSKILAEKVNGRAALIGVIALLGAYTTTSQINPGIF